jgi:hypothetical protein
VSGLEEATPRSGFVQPFNREDVPRQAGARLSSQTLDRMNLRWLLAIPSAAGALAALWVVENGALLAGQPFETGVFWFFLWLGPYVIAAGLSVLPGSKLVALAVFSGALPLLLSVPLAACVPNPGACEFLMVFVPFYTWLVVALFGVVRLAVGLSQKERS